MKTENEKGGPGKAGENRLKGLGVSPGIVVGKAVLLEPRLLRVPRYQLRPDDIDEEIGRFHDAQAETIVRLKQMREDLSGSDASEEVDAILDAHLQMLSGSRLMRSAEAIIREQRVNAEAAVDAAVEVIAAGFKAIPDPYLAARAEDVEDVGRRLIRVLMRVPTVLPSEIEKSSILFCEDMTPADAAALDPERVVGFATMLGGAASHTSIMARSLGLPAVLGVPGLLELVRTGDTVILDGATGEVVIRPTPATIADYEERIAVLARETALLARLKDVLSVTVDGTPVSLMGNIELPQEAEQVMAAGAMGIGLLRSEFLFMNRADLPDEDEQFELFRAIAADLGGHPLTIRTLDVGADKTGLPAEAMSPDLGANPALGLRAIRFSLRERHILEAQLAAILRVAALSPVRILLPMITSQHEIVLVRQILAEVARSLEGRGVRLPEAMPPLGAMIEVPAAALAADHLAEACDFFSIGTNDLTMYTLAIDRANEQVADLFDPFNPAVLRLIQFAASSAARAGIPVNLCGEMAGDEAFTELLLGFGIRELSMTARNLPRIKRRVRGIRIEAAEALASLVMSEIDPGRIADILGSRLKAWRAQTDEAG